MTASLTDQVSITAVLAHYGVLDGLRRRGANKLVGRCPIHGGSNDRQFIVDEVASTYYCFGNCNGGGGIVSLVAALERVSESRAMRRIATTFALRISSSNTSRRKIMSTGSRPSHRVLAVSERPDGNSGMKSFYTRIGVAFPIKDGKGLTLLLDAVPTNGKCLVVEFDDEEEPKPAKPKK